MKIKQKVILATLNGLGQCFFRNCALFPAVSVESWWKDSKCGCFLKRYRSLTLWFEHRGVCRVPDKIENTLGTLKIM